MGKLGACIMIPPCPPSLPLSFLWSNNATQLRKARTRRSASSSIGMVGEKNMLLRSSAGRNRGSGFLNWRSSLAPTAASCQRLCLSGTHMVDRNATGSSLKVNNLCSSARPAGLDPYGAQPTVSSRTSRAGRQKKDSSNFS